MTRTIAYIVLAFVSCMAVTTASSQWVKSKLPGNVSYVYAIVANGSNIFVGTWGGLPGNVFLSTDNGTSWTIVDSGSAPVYVDAFAVNGATIFAASYAGGISKSSDNGASWVTADSGLIDSSSSNVLCLASSNSTIFAGVTGNSGGTHNGRLYRSMNNGVSWTEIDSGLNPDTLGLTPYAIAVSGANLVVADGYQESILLSTDNGATWNRNSSMSNHGTVRSLAASGSKIVAGTDIGDVLLSTDNGTSWAAIDSGLDAGVYGLAWSGSNIFAGTASDCLGQVYLITYNGHTWDTTFTGLLNSYVFSLAVIGNDLFAGTDPQSSLSCPVNDTGSGVWRRPLSELITTSVAQSRKGIPKQYTLAQNYPNPFNPTTNIHYDLPKASFVHLSIFNVIGQEVRTLVNCNEPAGYKSVSFDGTNLPSGMYFYKISAGSFSDVKKMVLLK